MAGFGLVCLGEAVVDFTERGASDTGQALFERNPGGAPANVAVAAARLGLAADFVGKVGADAHGRFLRRSLEEAGVGTRWLAEDEGAFTTLAFVELDPATGERSFSFARKPGADTRLSPGEVPLGRIRSCRALHLGSLSLTDEPSRSSALLAARAAKGAGALVSFDPNYRASLWRGAARARERMEPLLGTADLVKVDLAEARLVCGEDDPARAARALVGRGALLAAVTLGGEGAVLASRSASVRVGAAPCRPRDTTGAGDAFWGALLAWALSGQAAPADLGGLGRDALLQCARYASAAAACCVERRGAIPAMPGPADVERRLALWDKPGGQVATRV